MMHEDARIKPAAIHNRAFGTYARFFTSLTVENTMPSARSMV
jgi:hypothetical protein